MKQDKRGKKNKDNDVVNPLDILDMMAEELSAKRRAGRKSKQAQQHGGKENPRPQGAEPKPRHGRAVFITGTDTGVGKTIVAGVLGLLLQKKGIDVGIMKPVQCGGDDAEMLQQLLDIKDELADIRPFQAKSALSPHVAFRRERIRFQPKDVLEKYHTLKQKHDMTLVEGAGGLLVPIEEKYLMADLIRALDIEVIVVARLGLGTINHTLLTIRQAEEKGLRVKGIIFSESAPHPRGLPEKTNPPTISRIAHVPVLGIIPYLGPEPLKDIKEQVVDKCRRVINLRCVWGAQPEGQKGPWENWDKKYIWHPFTQMKDWKQEEPLVIQKARGAYLEDVSGQKYLDGVSSLWVNVHGHGHPLIDQAIKTQINQLSHSTLLGLSHKPSISLAKKLVEISSAGLDKVFFSDNGSTAVEIAVKMAYQYWQNKGQTKKTLMAHLSHSYHGDTCGSVSIGGIDLFHKVYQKLVFQTLEIEFPDFYRAPEGKQYPDYTEECLTRMESILKRRRHEIAALVIEPLVQGAGGMIVWPEGVLKRIRELCYRSRILLIADEVATGFGRTGKMFACEHEGVSPDFLCLAKGLTGGYLPLAATLTSQKIFDGFCFDYADQKTFFHGHTYTGNPLCCAAALANLSVFEQEQTLQKLQPKIKYLEKALQKFSDLLHVGDVRQKGFMAGIELVRDKRSKKAYDWKEKVGIRVCQWARTQGVILRPLGHVIVLMPPLSISRSEMDRILEVTYEAIVRVTGRRPSPRRR